MKALTDAPPDAATLDAENWLKSSDSHAIHGDSVRRSRKIIEQLVSVLRTVRAERDAAEAMADHNEAAARHLTQLEAQRDDARAALTRQPERRIVLAELDMIQRAAEGLGSVNAIYKVVGPAVTRIRQCLMVPSLSPDAGGAASAPSEAVRLLLRRILSHGLRHDTFAGQDGSSYECSYSRCVCGADDLEAAIRDVLSPPSPRPGPGPFHGKCARGYNDVCCSPCDAAGQCLGIVPATQPYFERMADLLDGPDAPDGAPE